MVVMFILLTKVHIRCWDARKTASEPVSHWNLQAFIVATTYSLLYKRVGPYLLLNFLSRQFLHLRLLPAISIFYQWVQSRPATTHAQWPKHDTNKYSSITLFAAYLTPKSSQTLKGDDNQLPSCHELYWGLLIQCQFPACWYWRSRCERQNITLEFVILNGPYRYAMSVIGLFVLCLGQEALVWLRSRVARRAARGKFVVDDIESTSATHPDLSFSDKFLRCAPH